MFSVQKAYLKLIETCPTSPWFQWMWKSCCRSRLKFFFWLVLRDRINTRNLLRRKNRHLDSYDCVLCTHSVEETLMHLMFECPFSASCWAYLRIHWNVALMPDAMLSQARRNFNSKIFREVLIVGCWTIWCHKNRIIFDNMGVDLGRWKHSFKDELKLVSLRAKPEIKLLVDSFVCNLP